MNSSPKEANAKHFALDGDAALLANIPQGEANLKLVRRWLATILMRIETLIEIEEAKREEA